MLRDLHKVPQLAHSRARVLIQVLLILFYNTISQNDYKSGTLKEKQLE